MIAFEITINGEKTCTAGVDSDYGVLTSILLWAKRDVSQLSDEVRKKVPEEELKFTVGGQRTYQEKAPENLQWIEEQLKPGDEIIINIIDTSEIDQPKIRERQDPEFIKKQKLRYYQKLKNNNHV